MIFPRIVFRHSDHPGKIAGIDEINAIYAVHKAVQYMPEFPFRVMFIDLRKKGYVKNRRDADPSTVFKILVERFDTGEFHYFASPPTDEWAGTKHNIVRIPGLLSIKDRNSCGRGGQDDRAAFFFTGADS